MKKFLKWMWRLGFFTVLAVVLLLIFKDAILKAVIEQRLRSATGMEARIGKFEARLLSPVVDIENLRLYNTAEFGGSPFLVIPEIYAEYDRAALWGRALHFKLVRFNMGELNVVRNEAGLTNIVVLRENSQAGTESGGDATRRFGDLGRFEFAGIDTLNLSIGKFRYTDMQTTERGWTINLGIENRVLKDVKTMENLKSGLFFALLQQDGANALLNLLNGHGPDGESTAQRLVNVLGPLVR